MADYETEGALLLRALSTVLGWIYMLCWSLSFYPQPILNYQRRSTHGLAIDFPTLNLLGFVAYTIYTASLLYSPTIRAQYAARNPEEPESTVRFNDFLFALHAAVLCVIIYSQFFPRIWGFSVGSRQRASRAVLGIYWGSVVAVLIVVIVVLISSSDGGHDASGWAWIDVVYSLSYVKLVITIAKYIPQAWVNYKRRSTVGWSIVPILLDITGGILSLAQLVIDSALESNWSGISGNPVKLALSNVTIVFDVVFLAQHYILYRSARKDIEVEEDWPNERQGLLAPRIY